MIIPTPVVSAALDFEANFRGRERSGGMDLPPLYRDAVACALEDDCDLGAHLSDVMASNPPWYSQDEALRRWNPSWCGWVSGADERADADAGDARRARFCRAWGDAHEPTAMDIHIESLAYRAAAWKRAADEWDEELIEFHEMLRAASPGGVLAHEFFADRVHLTPHGYLFLARVIASRVAHVLDGGPEPPIAPPEWSEGQPYLDRTMISGVEVAFEQLARGWYLTGLPMAAYAPTAFPPEACARKDFCNEIDHARVAVGWLRHRTGLDHGLPDTLAPRLEGFDPLEVLNELRAAKRDVGRTTAAERSRD